MTRTLSFIFFVMLLPLGVAGCAGVVEGGTGETAHERFVEDVEVPTMDANARLTRESRTNPSAPVDPSPWTSDGAPDDE